jgi:hypothetical protein
MALPEVELSPEAHQAYLAEQGLDRASRTSLLRRVAPRMARIIEGIKGGRPEAAKPARGNLGAFLEEKE